MSSQLEALVSKFNAATSIHELWRVARDIMAAKALAPLISDPRFAHSFEVVTSSALAKNDLDTLLAIDLAARLSNANKKLRPMAERMVRPALMQRLPPLRLVATGPLPPDAKPSEIRENLARSLEWAEGGWVVDYIVESLLDEDRSSRCREEFARQLARREPVVDDWIKWLILAEKRLGSISSLDADMACVRCHDVLKSLTLAMRTPEQPLRATAAAGGHLQGFLHRAIQRNPNQQRPSKLAMVVVAVAEFLDALVLIDLSLLSEPEAYAALETIHRWWAPATYTDEMRVSLQPIANKLASAIRVIAKAGARSEKLSRLLLFAEGDVDRVRKRLQGIAESEVGLSGEIQDWLIGRTRTTAPLIDSTINSLRQRAESEVDPIIGRLLLESQKISKNDVRRAASDLPESVAGLIEMLAKIRGVAISGEVGEVVEFSHARHETISGRAPAESKVRVLRPTIVRIRQDGTTDVVVKALVDEEYRNL